MDDEEEEYIFYGTPLPEIEDETSLEVTLRKKAAKELEVRDEKGRQRFHGAFTGGFSAGYFNTVGTKEGWAPSSFSSSRGKTADRIQQNPEDFMDDEDFGEFGIASRKIHTTSNFQDTSGVISQKRRYVDTDNTIPGEAPLKDIVQPVRESIGISILKKLGWRQGQGIGPRIKKYGTGTKVYGCSPFPETAMPEEEDATASAFTYAPEDIEGMSFKSKDNYFGLGYTGLSKQSVLGSSIDLFAPTTTKSWLAKDKRKLKISGQAFGVGAFEDEDEDIYGKDDMSQYDFSDLALKGEEEVKASEPSKFDHLQGVLNGFHLASQPPLVKVRFPPPTLPANFKPVHLKSPSNLNQNLTNIGKSRHALSASDRSILLGERKFQKIPSGDKTQELNIEQIPIPSSSSKKSLNFQPFLNDVTKQQRYEEYLRLKRNGDVTKLIQPSYMTEWEKQQELEEFAKASVLFKPLSNALNSRFESRSHLSVEHEVMAELEKIKKEKVEKQIVTKKNLIGTQNRKTFEWHPVALLCKRMNVPNPYPNSNSSGIQQNVKAKFLFDHLTFTVEDSRSTLSKNFLTMPTGTKMEDTPKNQSDPVQKSPDIQVSATNKDDLPPTSEKPPMDFFKDIFENSSSEDEATGEKNKVGDEAKSLEVEILTVQDSRELKNIEDTSENVTSMQISSDKINESNDTQKKNAEISTIQNSSSKKKVGFGVFANLDLDALNERKPPEKSLSSNILEKKDSSSESKLKDNVCINEDPESDDTYGPQLPPNYKSTTTDSSVTTSSYYETAVPKKHAKSKSSHKHKHHKHKHKKKKKKSSKRNSSSSELSDDDIPPSLIIEKIKKLQKRKS